MPTEPSTAFVSYSRGDLEFVLRLAQTLRAKGARVWMDKLDIRPGQRWEDEIQAAVDRCARMLVVLSPSAIVSRNVLAEVSFGVDEGKEVIPVLYADCKIPFRLRPFQYADFRGDFDRGLDELLGALGIASDPKVVPENSPERPGRKIAGKPAGEAHHPEKSPKTGPRSRPKEGRELPEGEPGRRGSSEQATSVLSGRIGAAAVAAAVIALVAGREAYQSWNRNEAATVARVPAAPPSMAAASAVRSPAPATAIVEALARPAVTPAPGSPDAQAPPTASSPRSVLKSLSLASGTPKPPTPAARPANEPRSYEFSNATVDADPGQPSKPSLDELLEGALGKPVRPRAKGREVAVVRPQKVRDDAVTGSGGPLAKSAVVAGMNAIQGKVAACYQQYGEPGMAMVNVVISKSGKVTSAAVTGRFASTPTGLCVERAVKSASFPASDGLTTPYPFNLR